MMNINEEHPNGAVVVVAKCPIAGKSKTRLIPLLGEEGSAQFAKALLSDVLVSLSTKSSYLDGVLKVLLYAPGNAEGLDIMMEILQCLDLHKLWVLLPASSGTDLLSSGIGHMLADALERTRILLRNHNSEDGSVVFLGMDSPELALEEVVTALVDPSQALLCPANDGGYGMLSVPPDAPLQIFQHVRWSQPLTAVSQIKALTDSNISVKLGRLHYDMDEPEDVKGLAERLCRARSGDEIMESERKVDVLLRSSAASRVPLTTGSCEHTWNTLVSLGLIVPLEDKFQIRYDVFSAGA